MSNSASKRILIVEDERALSLALAATVRNCGGIPEMVRNLSKAKEAMEVGSFRGLILDIGLPDGHGLEFLKSIETGERPPTLVITAHGEIENAIVARKLGVHEFFDKPINFEQFKSAVSSLLKDHELQQPSGKGIGSFIGGAPAMRPVFQKIAHACASSEPVLIVGETGTGKTTAANLITENTGEKTVSWQPLSGGISIAEVIRDVADGILIIDPITSLSLEEQAELVSVWESDQRPFPRIIATAPPNLIDRVQNNTFRSDLFYRLQILEILLPELQERLDDIPVLVSYFLGLQDSEKFITASDSFSGLLKLHDWPGNLRELRNVISYATTISSGVSKIESVHLPDHIQNLTGVTSSGECEALEKAINTWLGETESLRSYREISGDLERILIEQLLIRFDGKLAPLAKTLKANRTTLRKKLNAE